MTLFGEPSATAEEIFAELSGRIAWVQKEYLNLMKNSVEFEKGILKGRLSSEKIHVEPNCEIKLQLDLTVRHHIQERQYPLDFRWILPEGCSVKGSMNAIIKADESLMHQKHGDGKLTLDFVLSVGELLMPQMRCVLEITARGRHTAIYVPLVLLG